MSGETQPLVVGVPKETFPGERRVALVPASIAALKKAGIEVQIEAGAGASAGFPDSDYVSRGATLVVDREQLFAGSSILLQVRGCGANPAASQADAERYRAGQWLIAQCEPLAEPQPIQRLADRGVNIFALELLPRITRAQSMDVLSSMASIAGYKAVLTAANNLPRMFPMLMTAAGTVTPAKVFVVGAGVAGLQAIATAKRLGAVVTAYDVRPAVRQ
jgi:NAD(P) transhydrogenase subunit alpha